MSPDLEEEIRSALEDTRDLFSWICVGVMVAFGLLGIAVVAFICWAIFFK